MVKILQQDNSAVIKKRFERDAAVFNAIYDKKSEFSGWLNRIFRKPIFERYDITFEASGDLRGKSVLDVGCGSGVYSVQCALNGAARVKGVDFSVPMLEIAKNRAKAHGVSALCEFDDCDFMQMNTNELFDYVIVMGVFDYLTHPLPFLKKLKSIAKGRIVASFPGHSLIREPLRRMRYLFTAKGQVYFYTRQKIEKLAADAQLSHVKIRPLKTGSGFILIADV